MGIEAIIHLEQEFEFGTDLEVGRDRIGDRIFLCGKEHQVAVKVLTGSPMSMIMVVSSGWIDTV